MGEKIIVEYQSVFEGLGCIRNFEYDIKLKDNAQPSIAVCRKIPLTLKDKVKYKLDKKLKEGIIERVSEPTAWTHPIVITKKNGSMRICVDLTELSKFAKRHHYKIPDIDDISAQMSGAKVFSILDGDGAFHQIKLSKNSQKLVTIITPFGRLKFIRLFFGINLATEIFHELF